MKTYIVLAIIVALCGRGSDACQSCLAEITRGLILGDSAGLGNQQHNHHHDHNKHVGKNQRFNAVAPITSSLPVALRRPIFNGRGLSGKGVDASVLGFLSVRKFISTVANNRGTDTKLLERNALAIQQQNDALLRQQRDQGRWLRILFASESEEDSVEKEEKDSELAKATESDQTSASMIMAIGFYKKFISPLLPPACRFLPTCSQYGVQAIEKFGPQKGLILTAWRLARCSPFGGKGYDPPVWPPVSYTYGSY